MCYSAQIVQLARKMQRELGVIIDFDEAEKIFFRRLEEPGLVISRGFEANFLEPANAQERRIKSAIDEYRSRAASKYGKELFAQKTRLVTGERSLKAKETKKAREDVRIATNKIDTLTSKLADVRRTEPEARDDRIFPLVYAGVIIHRDGHNVLTPMRYYCRPAGKPAFYDKKFPGLYNARRDNLEKFWSAQFGHDHALLIVESFYENVRVHAMERRELKAGEAERNVVLHFKPEPAQTMLVACLWSRWTAPNEPDLCGFAAITDEPPAEVAAAGHDRCIINIRSEHAEAWFAPEGRTIDALQSILSDRPTPLYHHDVLKAA
jgi:putative SOS response-associated peptidase YedK